MEKRKVLFNRPVVGSDEIQQHKDFNGLVSNYKIMQKPFFKKSWFIGGTSAVVAGLGITVFMAGKSPDQSSSKVNDPVALKEESSCVKKPLQNVDVKETVFIINPNRDTVLEYASGTKLTYDKNSLVDEKGNPVTGNVEIHYKEYHDVAEIFVSGIPMNYDSAGTTYAFESAGMLDINASCNDKPVHLKKGEEMKIEMASNNPMPFNVYHLDTIAKNWEYKGKENTSSSKTVPGSPEIPLTPELQKELDKGIKKLEEERDAKLENLENEIASIKKTEPLKPGLVNKSNFNFNIDVDKEEFPELAVYEKNRFEVLPGNKEFSEKIYDVEWEDARLKEITPGEKYEISLTRGLEKRKFTVKPVFEGADFEKAMKDYKEKYKKYEAGLENRVKEETRIKVEYANKISEWEKEVKVRQRELIKERITREEGQIRNVNNMVVKDERSRISGLVTKTFVIAEFGIWNCDKPNSFPDGNKVAAFFTDKGGNQLAVHSVYLAEKGKNLIYTYIPQNFSTFSFNPKKKNILWTVTQEGKLGYLTEEEFAAYHNAKDKAVFKLNILEVPIVKPEQVKELLGV